MFNNRLRTTGGRYHLETHEGVIKHELCHYHLHRGGKGYRHGDQEFKTLLQKVQGLRHTPSIEVKQERILRWAYRCQGCQTVIYRNDASIQKNISVPNAMVVLQMKKEKKQKRG